MDPREVADQMEVEAQLPVVLAIEGIQIMESQQGQADISRARSRSPGLPRTLDIQVAPFIERFLAQDDGDSICSSLPPISRDLLAAPQFIERVPRPRSRENSRPTSPMLSLEADWSSSPVAVDRMDACSSLKSRSKSRPTKRAPRKRNNQAINKKIKKVAKKRPAAKARAIAAKTMLLADLTKTKKATTRPRSASTTRTIKKDQAVNKTYTIAPTGNKTYTIARTGNKTYTIARTGNKTYTKAPTGNNSYTRAQVRTATIKRKRGAAKKRPVEKTMNLADLRKMQERGRSPHKTATKRQRTRSMTPSRTRTVQPKRDRTYVKAKLPQNHRENTFRKYLKKICKM